ncbi:Rab3-GAP regulatory subunit [Gracilaria domingensis]|nr:Rab3-GAP regulatory subunit [Gracilaria domingensis]
MRDTARKSVNAVLQRGRRVADDVDFSPDAGMNAASAIYKALQFRTATHDAPADATIPPDATEEQPADSALASFIRKRSLETEVATRVARLPQNTRIVERVVAAPLPCSLLATSDTLGRIFVQDPRDLCVLRVLKGYRDAQIAWLAHGGPLLVLHAPRLNVLELHHPLAQRRTGAFRLQPGSMLVQSTSHHVFVVVPDGNLYELMKSRKGHVPATPSGEKERESANVVMRQHEESAEHAENGPDEQNEMSGSQRAPDVELVDSFTAAVRKGRMSMAYECLQRVENDAYKLAYLMATLVTCTSYIRTEIHVAASSKAAEIASNLKNSDLVSRFEAHRKLAEAFGLLAADEIPFELSGEQARLTKYGPRLLEDELGASLAEFAVDELTGGSGSSRALRKTNSQTNPETELINCERFILSHAITPTLDMRAKSDYRLQPRHDLEHAERVWLSKAYFLKLLELDSVSQPTPGREHPATSDVFVALTEFIGLTESEITRQFVTFFLNVPLLSLLNTHVSVYASPLRCAIARLCSQFPPNIVDPIISDACETTSAIPNAVLLMRLCSQHANELSASEERGTFLESLFRLDEVLMYRKLVRGSSVSPEVYEKFVARRCTGVPGDAERHAITCLIDANDFNRAGNIIVSLHTSRASKNLDRHQFASISEAALHACRRKAAEFVTKEGSKVLPSGVLTWILAAQASGEPTGELEAPSSRDRRMREMRALLLNAHAYIADSSVDAVRCLQLAEALSALLELDSQAQSEKPVAPIVSHDLDEVKVETVDLKDIQETAEDMVLSDNNDNPAAKGEVGSNEEEFFDASESLP